MTIDEQNNPAAAEQSTPETPVATTRTHRRSDDIAAGFHNKTKGEFVFNNVVYLAISYLGVMAVSIFSSWLLRDSKSVAPHYKKLVNAVQEKFKGNRTGAALEKFRETVDSNMTIGAFFTGGTIATVLPVKWLEDKKASIVHSLDTLIYGREKVDNDPQIIEAHALLRNAPKQTWLSVFTSRVIAFAMTFGTSALMGTHTSPVGRGTGYSIDKQSAQFGRWMDRRSNAANPAALAQIERAAATSPNHILRDGPNADRMRSRIFSYVGLDAFYTAITASTLFVCTRILAPFVGAKNTSVTETAAVTASAAADAMPHTHPAATPHAHTPRAHVQASHATLHPRVTEAPLSQNVSV